MVRTLTVSKFRPKSKENGFFFVIRHKSHIQSNTIVSIRLMQVSAVLRQSFNCRAPVSGMRLKSRRLISMYCGYIRTNTFQGEAQHWICFWQGERIESNKAINVCMYIVVSKKCNFNAAIPLLPPRLSLEPTDHGGKSY